MEVSREFIDKLIAESRGKIESIILDQWRTEKDQWNLTYGYNSCDNKCEGCGIYLATRCLEKDKDQNLRISQILATPEDLKNYGNQRALNCKTIDQYVKGFVTCFTSGYTLESIDEELSYVEGFKLIYLKGVDDLEQSEKGIKKRIVLEVLENTADEKSKKVFQKKVKISI
ncbi:hypothetical protein HOD29_05675 [archaeon]|jgi:hypothetical protein|nr:hypothetical protein [archaeon]